MNDEGIKYHEHDMVRVEKPAIKSAKTLCWFVMAICIGGLFYYNQSPPATRAVIDQYSTWPCIAVGVFVVLIAIRAVLS